MKAEYKKPTIIIERFELCEHIASSCGLEGGWSTHWDPTGASPCGIRTESVSDDTMILFYESSGVCTITESTLSTMGLTMDDLKVVQYHGGTIPQFFSS